MQRFSVKKVPRTQCTQILLHILSGGRVGKQVSPQMSLVDAMQHPEMKAFWFHTVLMTA